MIKLNYPEFWNKKNFISTILIPFSWVYILLGEIRGLFTSSKKLPCYTICVGNMTVGGSGKTQVTKWLALLLKQDYDIVIVTKAYGSNLTNGKIVQDDDLASDVGDESKLLSKYATVIASKSIKQAIDLIKSIKPQIVIFDDGMQNPSVKKDMTILVVNNVSGVGNGRIFPSGPLRQSVSSALNQSDIVVSIGDGNYKTSLNIERNLPIFTAQIKPTNDLKPKGAYLAFSGIAHPSSFFNSLKTQSFNVVKEISFPDHHDYSKKDLENLNKIVQNEGLNLITTEKDYVKINHMSDLEYLAVNLEIKSKNQLKDIIYEKIKTYI